MGSQPQQPADTQTGRPVPLVYKVLYGSGYITVALSTFVVITWLLNFYRPLASGLAFAGAVIFGRVVDAVADPLIGSWSDRLKTRWGRRKPLIFVGGPLMAIGFVLIWAPPVDSQSPSNALYLAATMSFFLFAFTVAVCPYLAMLQEITEDRAERISLGVWQGGFFVVGAVGGAFVGGYLIEYFQSYLAMALCFAPVILLCSWLPLLVPTPVEADRPSVFSLREGILRTFRNPLFPPYVISQVVFWTALQLIVSATPPTVEVRAGATPAQSGAIIGVALLVAGVLMPVVDTLGKRMGKKSLLLLAMILFGVVMVPVAFLGDLPLPLSPMGQALLLMGLAGPPIAGLFALPNAMVADIVDRDEELTGQRRAAIYFGVQGMLVKAGMGLGLGLARILLGGLGDTASRQGGFVACPLVAMALAWAAAAVLTRYRGP